MSAPDPRLRTPAELDAIFGRWECFITRAGTWKEYMVMIREDIPILREHIKGMESQIGMPAGSSGSQIDSAQSASRFIVGLRLRYLFSL